MHVRWTSLEELESRIAPAFSARIDLSLLVGDRGFSLPGVSAEDYAGFSVSNAGDINGDGFSDMIIGAPFAGRETFQTGSAYVIFGAASGFPDNLELSTLDGRNGFRLIGSDQDERVGVGVADAGDFNGDGLGDLLVCGTGRGTDTSGAYIVFGTTAPFSAQVRLDELNGANGFKMTAGSGLGFVAVAGNGDVNGDGIDDVVIGADFLSPSLSGAAYVVFGKATTFAAILNISALDGTNGFKLEGESGSDRAGFAVSSAGDVNGDGFDDILIGAPHALTVEGGDDYAGAGYLVFGKQSFSANVDLAGLDGSMGFKLAGAGTTFDDRTGYSVSIAPDINGDGFDDMIVGAPGAGYGTTYVVFGSDQQFLPKLELGGLNPSTGLMIAASSQEESYAGSSVSGIGDFNGDGLGDLLIGASQANASAFASGAAYVVFGTEDSAFSRIELSGLDGRSGFKIKGAQSGAAIGSAVGGGGDINGDGWPDIVLGAPQADRQGNDTGRVYVMFGGDPGRLRISADGHTAKFTETDGDLVRVQTNRGLFTKAIFNMRFEGFGFQIEKLELTDPAFSDAKLIFSATRQDANNDGTLNGNGRVDVGYLDALGVDLRSVTITGDLGQIDVGDGDPLKPGIKTLNVRSLGEHALSTQDPTTATLHSDLAGDIKILTVKRGITGGVTLAVAGRLGTAMIGGDFHDSTISVLGALLPQTATEAGAIQTLTIGGNVSGSQVRAGYDLTGAAVNADASVGKVKVKGSWAASDIVTGIIDTTNDGFGRNDTVIGGGSSLIIAEIAKVVIKGTATGSADFNEFFGITAEAIAVAKIGGAALTLSEGKDDLLLDETNGNFRLLEL